MIIKADGNEALAMYQRAIEIDPTYGDAYNNLGIYYAKQEEDMAKLLLCFKKLSNLTPRPKIITI